MECVLDHRALKSRETGPLLSRNASYCDLFFREERVKFLVPFTLYSSLLPLMSCSELPPSLTFSVCGNRLEKFKGLSGHGRGDIR